MPHTVLNQAGGGIDLDLYKHEDKTTSSIASDDPWFSAFRRAAVDKHQLDIKPLIFPAATDSRFIRAVFD